MSCSADLWEGLIKNKGGVELFQISQKERPFHLLWHPSALWGNLTKCPPSCTLQKRTSCLLQFGQEENIPGRSIERRAYWFILKITRIFSVPTSRNRMMNTFIYIIVNITPTCKRKFILLDKTVLFHSKKAFLLPSVWPGTEYTWSLIWKKRLLICFESCQGIPHFHTGRVDRNMNTFLMVNINPICKR